MAHGLRRIGVHDGSFHTDECMAVAILRRNQPGLEVTRTRDSSVLSSLDARVDVGFKYDHSRHDYDHHQKEGAGERDNEVPYASAGLIWKHYGSDCVSHQDAFYYVDRRLIQAIDAEDNGIRPSRDVPFFTFGEAVRTYNNTEDFEGAVSLCGNILDRVIAEGGLHSRNVAQLRKYIPILDGDAVITDVDLDELGTWQYYVVPDTDLKYIISPKDDSWKVRAVPTQIEGFEPRVPFPEAWRGKTGKDLATPAGISDAVFCHKAGFLAVAKSQSSAIEIARISLAHS